MTEKEKERFLTKFKQDDPSKCWEWLGFKRSTNKYGGFNVNINGKEKMKLAHRLSYELFIGPIPEGLCVCHSCDNRICVNPNHLWLGTPKDNALDCAKKGRTLKGEKNRLYRYVLSKEDNEKRLRNLLKKVRGESNNRGKLTESQVREIRNSDLSRRELAKIYGLEYSTVRRIKIYRSWSWLK